MRCKGHKKIKDTGSTEFKYIPLREVSKYGDLSSPYFPKLGLNT